MKKKVNELSLDECKALLSQADVPFDPKADVNALRELVRVNALADSVIHESQDTLSDDEKMILKKGLMKQARTREELDATAKKLKVVGFEDAKTKGEVIDMIFEADPNYSDEVKNKGVTVVKPKSVVLPEKGEVQLKGLANHKCEMNREPLSFNAGDVFKVEAWKAKILIKAGVAELK